MRIFWRELDVSCTIWNHCQVICCFDYINLLFYQYLICDVVWAPTSITISKLLICLHSCFLQQVPDCNSFIKVTLSECCCFHIAVQLVFKVLHQLCPGYLKDCVTHTCTHTHTHTHAHAHTHTHTMFHMSYFMTRCDIP